MYCDLDWAALRDTMRHPLIIDGRRLLPEAELRGLGYMVHRLGDGVSAASDPLVRIRRSPELFHDPRRCRLRSAYPVLCERCVSCHRIVARSPSSKRRARGEPESLARPARIEETARLAVRLGRVPPDLTGEAGESGDQLGQTRIVISLPTQRFTGSRSSCRSAARTMPRAASSTEYTVEPRRSRARRVGALPDRSRSATAGTVRAMILNRATATSCRCTRGPDSPSGRTPGCCERRPATEPVHPRLHRKSAAIARPVRSRQLRWEAVGGVQPGSSDPRAHSTAGQLVRTIAAG